MAYLEETYRDPPELGRSVRETDEEAPPDFESETIVQLAEEITHRTAVRVKLI